MPKELPKKISIISPCFNEEENIKVCVETVQALFEGELKEYRYEHIFADNASSDGSVRLLREIAEENPSVKVILNARNYGPFVSTFNALRAASGDAVLVMLPVDLQDPPELIPRFVEVWSAGTPVVYGQRVAREEGIVLRNCRRLFYWMITRFAQVKIPMNTAEFQLIDRKVHQELMRYHDYYPYIRGMIANLGFDSASLEYTWKRRERGISKNNIYALIDQALNGLVSFTNIPMRIATLTGFSISFLSILYSIVQLIINLFFETGVVAEGIPTLIVAVFFFSGLQLFFIGWIGEYIAAIHTQVRRGDVVHEKGRINFNLSEQDLDS